MDDRRYPTSAKESALLLYHCNEMCGLLLDYIEAALRPYGWSFKGRRRYAWNNMMEAINKARYWFEQTGASTTIWNAAEGDVESYDGFWGDTREIMTFVMMYIDRAKNPQSRSRILRTMQALPENGIFTREDIRRWQLKDHPVFPEPGDEVYSRTHGRGTILQEFNKGDYQVDFDGTVTIVNESDFI